MAKTKIKSEINEQSLSKSDWHGMGEKCQNNPPGFKEAAFTGESRRWGGNLTIIPVPRGGGIHIIHPLALSTIYLYAFNST